MVAACCNSCFYFTKNFANRTTVQNCVMLRQSARTAAQVCFNKPKHIINFLKNSPKIMLQPYTSTLKVFRNYTATPVDTNKQTLPRLPVPKLDDTLAKFLKSAQPHLTENEFKKTTETVKDFACGVGQQLQKLLEERAQKHVNWLEDWWLSTAYLGYRDPVVVFSSPGLVFPFRKFCTQEDQLMHAAKTISAALDYKSLIDNNKIPLEKMGKNPLDMSQYKKIFGTCRVPREKVDELSYNNTKYITVMHQNHIFHVDLWGSDGVRLSESQIADQLQQVIEMSPSPSETPVGIFTSENRDTWAKANALLEKEPINLASLRDVRASLAVLCLDQPVGLWNCSDKGAMQNLAAQQTIHGNGSQSNGANRWFDKTVQFIVGADGLTGLTYEHSPAEGQPIAVLTDYIIDYIDKGKVGEESRSSAVIPPSRLQFNTQEVCDMIPTAQHNLDKLVANLDLDCFTFDKYGKDFIKSQKMSPDSYIQMALQYAFYRCHQVPGAHYESAATRMFAGGRTETIRSCSLESVAFARAMLRADAAPSERAAALRAAVQAHKDYTVQALQGLGVDRHLLGLKLIAAENCIKLPDLYADPGYVRSAHMRISTSQVACKCDGFMCYGPLVPDGYAACYNPRARDINVATSAFRAHPDTSASHFRCELEQAFTHMHDTLLQTTSSKL